MQLSRAEKDLVSYLSKIARRAARKLKVEIKEFKIFNPRKKPRAFYGLCVHQTKTLIISLYEPKTKKLYPLPELVDTVLHEVAHLKHTKGRVHHSKEFYATLEELKGWYMEVK